jgi:hypothetical protein
MVDIANSSDDPGQTSILGTDPSQGQTATAPVQTAAQPPVPPPNPQATSPQPPAPQPNQPAKNQPQPPSGHRTFMAEMLQAVSGVLAGNPTQRFDPDTNKAVPIKLTTGQVAENMIGAGLRGAAAGLSQVGPGSKGRAFAAGLQQQQQINSQADKRLWDQGAFAKSAIDTARAGWQFQREKTLVHENSQHQYDALDDFIGADPRNKDLGTFKTFADFLAAHPDMQAAGSDVSKLGARGLLINSIPTDDAGHALGVHAWQVDPDWKNETVGAPYAFREYAGDKGDGTGPQFKDHTMTAETPNSTILHFLTGSAYGTLGVPPQTGATSHAEAVQWLASGSDAQKAAAQAYINTENRLSKDDALSKLENVPSLLARENAAAAIPQLQNMLSTEPDPDKRLRINRLISTAQAAHRGYVQDQQSEANSRQVASQGDPDAAGRLLANGSLTLADLKTRGMTPNFILQATNSAQRINPSYKPADETVAETIAKSPAANQFFGSANSLIQQGGTLDQLVAIGAKIPQGKIPALNTIDDWQQIARGKGDLAGYAATLLGVADDAGKVMGGGTASDSARNSTLSLIGRSQSPDQRAQAIKAIRDSVSSQIESRIGTNQFLRRQYGYALPQSTTSQGPPQKAPAAQAWSLAAWQRANPNGDPNAAKAAAAQQGYQVIP